MLRLPHIGPTCSYLTFAAQDPVWSHRVVMVLTTDVARRQRTRFAVTRSVPPRPASCGHCTHLRIPRCGRICIFMLKTLCFNHRGPGDMSGQSSVATCAPYDVSDVLRALLALVHVHYMYWARYDTLICLNCPYSISEFYFFVFAHCSSPNRGAV